MRSLLLLPALALVACSGDDAPDGQPLPYQLSSRPVLPFPSDDATLSADTATGLHLNIRARGETLGDVDEAIYLFGDNFTDELSALDGWSTLGPSFVSLGVPPDPATLDDHLFLVDLERRQKIPLRIRAITGETDYGRVVHWAQLRPLVPLAEATPHAIVATRGLTTEDGTPFARPAIFDAVWSGDTDTDGEPDRLMNAVSRLDGVDDALAAVGIEPDDVLVAERYTTLSIQSHADALIDAMAQHPPTFTVTSTASGASPIRARVTADFDIPAFREEPDAPIDLTIEPRFETVEALVLVPEGEGPFPILVFHHGLGGEKEKIVEFAQDILPSGVAVVAIDAPLHGARTERPGNAGTRFLNVVAPTVVADNMRQAQVDQVYFAAHLDRLAATDLLKNGETVLDASRVMYLGESLGSIVGAAVVGLSEPIDTAVLMVGGGTLLEFFDQVLSGFEFDGFPTQMFTTVAQSVLDRGDPSNFAARSLGEDVFLLQGMTDTVVPPGATESLARAMGLPIVAPAADAPEGIEVIDGPVAGRGWTQFPGVGHNLFYERDKPTWEQAHGQLSHYVATWAATGVGEIKTR
ncbi:MAG: hypothetical protein RIT81_25475 [Deltaproteobacteria bacterium]